MKKSSSNYLKKADIALQKKILKEGYLYVLLVFAVIFFIGLVGVLIDLSRGGIRLDRLFLYGTASIVFLVATILTKKQRMGGNAYLLLILFYLGHGFMELYYGYTPYNYIRDMSIAGSGTVSRGGVFLDAAVILYYFFRLALVFSFVKILHAQNKLKKYGV